MRFSLALKAGGVFTLLTFLPSVIKVFLLPIYLKYLNVEEFGMLALLNIYNGLYVVLGGLQLSSAAKTIYFDYNDKKEHIQKFISSIFTISILVSTLTYILFALLGSPAFNFLLKSNEFTFSPYGFIILTSGLFSKVFSIYLVFLKNEYKLRKFFIYSIAVFIGDTSLQLFFIVIMEMGILGVLLGTFISTALVTFTMLIFHPELLDFKPDKAIIKKALNFSISFTPFVFVNWLIAFSDRLFLAGMLSLDDVGRYTILINLLFLATSFFWAIENAIYPMLFNFFKELNAKDVKSARFLFSSFIKVGMITFSGVIMIGSNLNLITDNERYISVIPFFSIGALVMLPRLWVRVPQMQLMFLKKSKIISINSVLTLSVLIGCFFIFIPVYKLEGALYAIGVANILNLVLFHKAVLKTSKFGASFLLLKEVVVTFSIILTVSLIYFLFKQINYSLGLYGIVQFLVVVILFGLLFLKENRQQPLLSIFVK